MALQTSVIMPSPLSLPPLAADNVTAVALTSAITITAAAANVTAAVVVATAAVVIADAQ
jgi:hypothetical protein